VVTKHTAEKSKLVSRSAHSHVPAEDEKPKLLTKNPKTKGQQQQSNESNDSEQRQQTTRQSRKQRNIANKQASTKRI
jgi:hypothetical protein